jgi:outer membrane lipoprotein carrier protein
MKLLIVLIFFINSIFATIFDIETYEANFKQTITNNSAKEILYKGKIYLTNTNKVLWRYQEPIVKDVYINNNQVIIDEPELEQAIISTVDDDLNLLKILKESKKIDKKTYINSINDIKYTIKTYQDSLKAIFYTDEIGNKVKIIFTDEKINETIDNQIFEFNYPSHYDIIRK